MTEVTTETVEPNVPHDELSQDNSNEVVERGKAAWARLKKDQTWEDWLQVGETLAIGRKQAMRTAGASKPAGKGYTKVFSAWLKENGFDEIDGAVRSRLFDAMAHCDDIERWRATLTRGEKLTYNHPTTVWRHWQAATKVPDPTKPKMPSATRLGHQLALSPRRGAPR